MQDDSAPRLGAPVSPEATEGLEVHSVVDSAARDDEPVGQSLTRVISLLVDHPEAVHVRAERRRAVEVFYVRVDPDDLGQVIGRRGRTAQALRTLLDIRGARDGRRYALEILET